MKSFRGKALGLTSLWVIALELQLTATRCVNMPKAAFLPAAMYTDASMQHMAMSYTLHAVLHFRSMATQYAYCYVRNPVACPVMSAQAFFVTASIALGERGLTLHKRNFAIPL